MHAVVRYALWAHRHLKEEPDAEERLRRVFEVMPEVQEVLDLHLDPKRDPILAIRAVYGQWFPWLVLLDEAWVKDRLGLIFPTNPDGRALHNTAWERPTFASVRPMTMSLRSCGMGTSKRWRDLALWVLTTIILATRKNASPST